MQQLNRRQWLKSAGITSAFSLLGGFQALADTNVSEEIVRSAPTFADPIRLSSNENPYGPSKKVREAIIQAFDHACRYPSKYRSELQEKIAAREGVDPEQIIITGGSWEGLKVTGLTYGLNGGEVVSAAPTYLALMTYAERFGAHIHRVPLDDNLMHDLEAMEKRVTNRTSLIFVCNPNNPTGTLLPAAKLKDFCVAMAKRAIVFVDEAYSDYIEESAYPSGVELVKQGLNVIISRTFSKVYGLAGVRIGYLITRPDIAARISPNVPAGTNVLALFAAKAALEDKGFYRQSLENNAKAKNLIYATLDGLKLKYQRSHANFVFFHTGRDIQEFNREMLDLGVRVGRPFPPLNDWCRISTGTIDEVKMFTQTLKKVMA